MFKNSRIEAGTNKNIPCMESYADFKMAVGANRIVRQASPALDTQCPMTCSRTTGRRGARSDRPEQQEADISDAKKEISDLGTESHDTKQELKRGFTRGSAQERGHTGSLLKLYEPTKAIICARSARNCCHDSGAILPHSRDVRPDQDYRVKGEL